MEVAVAPHSCAGSPKRGPHAGAGAGICAGVGSPDGCAWFAFRLFLPLLVLTRWLQAEIAGH